MCSEHTQAMKKMRAPLQLKENFHQLLPEHGQKFRRAMGLFQNHETKSWLRDVAKCSMIVPTISNDDLKTKKGAAKVMFSQILLLFVMKGQDH